MSKEGIYAVYKGDEFIDLGTKKQLAKTLNCKTKSIAFMTTPCYKKRIKGKENRLTVIKVEEE